MKRSFSGLLEVVTCVNGTSTGWLMPWWRIGTVVWPEHGHRIDIWCLPNGAALWFRMHFRSKNEYKAGSMTWCPVTRSRYQVGGIQDPICKRHFARFCDHAIRNLVQCSLACPLPRLITGIHSSAHFCKPPSNPTSWLFDTLCCFINPSLPKYP